MASDDNFDNATMQSSINGTMTNVTTTMTSLTTMTSATILSFSTFAQNVQLAMKYVTIVAMIIVMVAMGCTFDINVFIRQIKRPMGIIICLFCQFGLFPLACFGIAHASGLKATMAIAMVLLSSCPGGVFSNILCFWAGADVTLSITLTVVSTFVGMGMTPLNLWIYGRSWDTTEIHMPYIQILLILVALIVPSCIGILIKIKFPKVAQWIAKIGSFIGMILIVIIAVLNPIAFPTMLQQDAKIYIVTGAMPIIAFVIGHVCSWIGRLSPGERVTVAFEICVQNIGIVFVVSSVTFPVQQYVQIINFCLPFGVWLIIDGFILLIVSRVCLKCVRRKQDKHIVDDGAVTEGEHDSLYTAQENVTTKHV